MRDDPTRRVQAGSTWTAKVELPRDPISGARRSKWISGFPTRKEAERAAVRLRSDLMSGTWGDTPRDLTLARYLVDQWLPLVEARDLKATTKASYRMIVNTYVVPRIGHVLLSTATPMTFERLLADLRQDGRAQRTGGLSAKSRRNIHGVLHKAYGDALRNGLVARNPLDAVLPPRDDSDVEPTAGHRVWTPAQVQAFLDRAQRERLGSLLFLVALTGARRGELVGLLWEDVDLDAATIHIRRAAVIAHGKGVVISTPKTRRSQRTIHIDPTTVAVLRRHRGAQAAERLAAGGAWQDSGLVFPAVTGLCLHPGLVTKAFNRLVEAAGLPRIRLHDLRHTHASVLLAGNVPVTDVSERLGHANPSITLNIYSHVIPGRGAKVALLAADLLLGTPAPDEAAPPYRP